MSIHLSLPPKSEPKRCDTRALANARIETHRRLRDEIEEQRFDAKMPRHFEERQRFLQTGDSA